MLLKNKIVPIAEQGISSVLGFGVGLIALGLLSLEDFGRYSVIFSVSVFLQYIMQSVLIEPAVALKKKSKDDTSSVYFVIIVCSIILSGLFSAILTLAFGFAFNISFLYLSSIATYYFMRRYFLLSYHESYSIVLSLIICLIAFFFYGFQDNVTYSLNDIFLGISLIYIIPSVCIIVLYLFFKNSDMYVDFKNSNLYLKNLYQRNFFILPSAFFAWFQTNSIILFLFYLDSHELNGVYRVILIFSAPAMQIVSQLAQLSMRDYKGEDFNFNTSARILVMTITLSLMSSILFYILARLEWIEIDFYGNEFLLFLSLIFYPIGMTLHTLVSVHAKMKLSFQVLFYSHVIGVTFVIMMSSIFAFFLSNTNVLILSSTVSMSYLVSAYFMYLILGLKKSQ